MKVSIIVAMNSDRVIGNNGGIPWHIPADLKHFKDVTNGHALIMGRKTHESIGIVLPDRDNVVLSRNAEYFAPGCINSYSLNDAIDICKENNIEHAFIIGGGEIYKQALDSGIVDYIYMTKVYKQAAGDAYFPELDMNEWVVTKYKLIINDNDVNFNYEFIEYRCLI